MQNSNLSIETVAKKARGGWDINKIPFEDKKVCIQVSVKRKHFNIALKEVTDLIQKYR